MSENPTDYSSHQWNKRLSSSSSHSTTLPSSSEFNTTSIVNNKRVQNDSPSSHTSPLVSDVCVSSQNAFRNASTTTKLKDNGSSNGNFHHDKFSLTLNLNSGTTRTRIHPTLAATNKLTSFEMNDDDDTAEDLHSPFDLDVPICDSQPLKKVPNEFLIDRMFKDDQQYRSPNQSTCSNSLNVSSSLPTPSSEHRDIDALSDAGTYVIEDDVDVAQDDEPDVESEPKITAMPSVPQTIQDQTSSPFRRYVTSKRHRHGTFEIRTLAPTSNVHRPIVDTQTPTRDLSSPSSSSNSSRKSSCSSSLLSLPTESDTSLRREPEGASHHLLDDQSSNNSNLNIRERTKRPVTPPQNPIKPAECFVISPTFETKPFPNPRRRADPSWKPRTNPPLVEPTPVELPIRKSPSPPPISTRSIPNDSNKYSFRLQQHLSTQGLTSKSSPNNHHVEKLSTVTKSSIRPHVAMQDQNFASSPFQRNAPIRQTMPANAQYHRPISASTNSTMSTTTTTGNKYLDDPDETLSSHPSLTKVYMNKSFALRRQRSNLAPATTTKPLQAQSQPSAPSHHHQQQQQTVSKTLVTRQILKTTPSAPPSSSSLVTSSMNNSTSGQTNRAVELRRARAQAKIEELAQRTRQQLQKTEQHNDIMSASWHSNASSSSKKDFFHGRTNPRSSQTNVLSTSQKQDLSKTRTISSSSHHRSSSASPNPMNENSNLSTNVSSRYRRAMVSSVTDEKQYQKLNGNLCSDEERCGSLRDDGQRLAIKLIQLSSGILAKLKPGTNLTDSDTNVRELEQLVDKLQTVNRTLSTIDASLTTPTSDESLI